MSISIGFQVGDCFSGTGSQKGWEFKVLERMADWVLVEKTCGDDWWGGGASRYWEVVRPRWTPERWGTLGGKPIRFQAKWRYPSDEAFGLHGFCFGSPEAARKRLAEVGGMASPQQ